MAYEEGLARRIRQYFQHRSDVVEKKMFGGLAFMVAGHMCVGVQGHRLMARVGPRHYDSALQQKYVTIMDFTGKPLKGFVYVEPEAVETDKQLAQWIEHCNGFVGSLPPK